MQSILPHKNSNLRSLIVFTGVLLLLCWWLHLQKLIFSQLVDPYNAQSNGQDKEDSFPFALHHDHKKNIKVVTEFLWAFKNPFVPRCFYQFLNNHVQTVWLQGHCTNYTRLIQSAFFISIWNTIPKIKYHKLIFKLLSGYPSSRITAQNLSTELLDLLLLRGRANVSRWCQ